jgi:hypothetical protein
MRALVVPQSESERAAGKSSWRMAGVSATKRHALACGVPRLLVRSERTPQPTRSPREPDDHGNGATRNVNWRRLRPSQREDPETAARPGADSTVRRREENRPSEATPCPCDEVPKSRGLGGVARRARVSPWSPRAVVQVGRRGRRSPWTKRARSPSRLRRRRPPRGVASTPPCVTGEMYPRSEARQAPQSRTRVTHNAKRASSAEEARHLRTKKNVLHALDPQGARTRCGQRVSSGARVGHLLPCAPGCSAGLAERSLGAVGDRVGRMKATRRSVGWNPAAR